MASIFVCGDIVNYGCESGRVCAPDLAEIIADADYSIGNFEAPVQSPGKPQPKSGIHHQQRAETVAGLRAQGFDLLLLANNHIMDYGAAGLAQTLKLAEEAGLDTLGAGMDPAGAYQPLLRTIGGFRVAMLNAAEAQFGLIDGFNRAEGAGFAWINDSRIDKTLLQLRKRCDIIIVFSHAGLEHYPIPQKEWRDRYRHLCDLGADVVIGSHPHVPQGYEIHSGSLIFYSLGNFFFDSKNYRNNEDRSYSVLLELSANRPLRFKPIYHHKQNGVVQISSADRRIDLEDLCRRLENDYERQHDLMSLQAYDRIRRNLRFSLLPLSFAGGARPLLRRMASLLLGRGERIDKNLLLLHLLRNEAYRFAATHALEVLAREKYCKPWA